MKNKTKHRILFDSGGCLTQQTIMLFIDGKLSETEIRKLKKHTANCDLCADALEGAAHFQSGQIYHKRIEQMHQSSWRRTINSRSKSKRLFYGISSAAASIVILIGVYLVLRVDRVLKDEFDTTSSQLVSSELENTSMPTDKQALILQNAKSESERLKKKEIEKIIKEDLKTIEEPAEKLIVADVETDIDLLDEESLVMESNNEIEVEIPVVEEAMRVEYSKDELPDIQTITTKDAAVSSAKKDKSLEEPIESTENKKGLLRKSKPDKSLELQSFYIAEVTPMFQGGGVEKFNHYLLDNLKVIIPDSVMVQSIIISFVVDTTGAISKVKLVTGTSSEELNASIIEYIKTTPVWIPGHKAGKAINSVQQTEVVFDTIDRGGNLNLQ